MYDIIELFTSSKHCIAQVSIHEKASKIADYYNERYLITVILLAFSILLHAKSML